MMETNRMQILTKLTIFIFTLLITTLVSGSLVFADELGITKDDMEDMIKSELEISKHNIESHTHSHEVAKLGKTDSEINFVNKNEQIEEELLDFSLDSIRIENNKAKPNKVKLPESILNFGSSVYVAQPLVTGNRDSIYKGASRDDLDTDIGAAFKLVILNK